MGLGNKIIRSLKRMLKNIFGFITRKKRRKKTQGEPTMIPASWQKPGDQIPGEEKLIRIKHRKRIPGLRQIKRFLAAIWLLMNFVISQFLLGSIGAQAQPVFFFFLGNSFFLLDYLWKTRSKPDEK